MAEYKIIKLTDMSPLHIGSGKENYDFASTDLHSDSISAALAAIAVQTGEKDVKAFLDSFRISSAFPYVDNGLYYLPRMIGNFKLPKEDLVKYRKELKNIRYIYSEYWDIMARGKDFQDIDNFFPKNDEKRLGTSKIAQVNERVTIDENGSTPFFFEWSFFKKDCGLYFIVDADDNTFDTIKSLFETLGYFGIGTDKSVGGGKFSIKESRITLPDVENANATMLLSTYIPSQNELPNLGLKNGARYDLVCRGGYISGSNNENLRHYRKNVVNMFNVGSVFPSTETLGGEVVNLKPSGFIHDVWRSGRPLTIKVRI